VRCRPRLAKVVFIVGFDENISVGSARKPLKDMPGKE
jgi:hypothetical protein